MPKIQRSYFPFANKRQCMIHAVEIAIRNEEDNAPVPGFWKSSKNHKEVEQFHGRLKALRNLRDSCYEDKHF